MKETEPRGRRPEEYTETAGGGEGVLLRKGQHPLGEIPFQLSAAELSDPGALKMVVGEVHRLRYENLELRKIRDQFHVCDRDAAVLRERIKQSNARDIVLGSALALGSAIVGLAPSLSGPARWIAIVVGGAMVAGAVVGRIVAK